jgi:hypothetical protein
MRTLITPHQVPNIRKFEVLKWTPDEDDNEGTIVLLVQGSPGQYFGPGGGSSPWVLRVRNVAGSDSLTFTESPLGYADIIKVRPNSNTAVFSALLAADKAATGGRAAHRLAVESVLVANGVLGPGFEAT